MAIFWVAAPCNLVEADRCSVKHVSSTYQACYLQLRNNPMPITEIIDVSYSLNSVNESLSL